MNWPKDTFRGAASRLSPSATSTTKKNQKRRADYAERTLKKAALKLAHHVLSKTCEGCDYGEACADIEIRKVAKAVIKWHS